MPALNHQLHEQLRQMLAEMRITINNISMQAWAQLGNGARQYPKADCAMYTIFNHEMNWDDSFLKSLMFMFVGGTPRIRSVLLQELNAIMNSRADVKMAWIDYHQLWDISENSMCWDACFYEERTQVLLTIEGFKAPGPNPTEKELLNDQAVKVRAYIHEDGIKGMLSNDDMANSLGSKRVKRLRGILRI